MTRSGRGRERLPGGQDRFFLPLRGRGGDEDGASACHPLEALAVGERGSDGQVVLHVAHRPDPGGRNPEFLQPPRVLAALHEKERDPTEGAPEPAPQPAVAGIGAFRDPAVDERDRYSARRRAVEEERPQLRLGQKDEAGTHPGERPLDGAREVEREREDRDAARDDLQGELAARRRRDGKAEPASPRPRGERGQEGGRHADFPHRDRVDPDSAV